MGDTVEPVGDTQRLLQPAAGALEVASRRYEHLDKPPSPLPAVAAAAALLLVCAGTFLLVFESSGGGGAVQPLPAPQSQLPVACQAMAEGPFWDWLLPQAYSMSLSLEPAHFAVNLSAPGLGAPGEFAASVSVTLTALRSGVGCVMLHARGMRFRHASLQAAPGTPGPAGGEQVLCGSEAQCGRVIVPVRSRPQRSTLDQDLVAVDLGGAELPADSSAVLQLHYAGNLATDGLGLHRSDPFVVCSSGGGGGSGGDSSNSSTAGGSSGVAGDGAGGGGCRAAVLVATQLEPTGARRLLPCYDGPRFKAQFRLELEYPAGLVALSNMPPAQGPEPAGGSQPGGEGAELERVAFEPTPLMSPYLLALAVGELQQYEPADGGPAPEGPEVRLWAVPGKVPQLRVAHAAGTAALSFFTAWTGIEQPLGKFDMVAVPGKGGAMENWGLLLFDETRFLVNEATEGAYGMWLAADVVCHETAHQWFGNLVTAPDWTQLTVNEGVASFMEYKCLEAAFPQMPGRLLLFRATSPSAEKLGIHEGPTQRILAYDGDPLLPPLLPASPFDQDGVVIYSKGAALLRMLEDFLDRQRPGAFRAGMQAFVQRHKGATATMANLLSALADQAALISKPPNSEPLAAFAQLARQYASSFAELAGAPLGEAGSGNNALSANPLGAWLHAPSYPYLPFEEAPAAAPGNSSNDSSAWVQLAATRQRPFCAWQPEQVGNTSAGPSGAGGVAGECPAAGTQWWLPLDMAAAFSLPACGSAAGNSSSLGGSSSGTQEPAWVLNPVGAGLYRVAYPDQHMQRLLGALSQLEPCYRASNASASGGGGQLAAAAAAPNNATSLSVGSRRCGSLNASSCELEAAPLLAASAALSDAAALAQTGQVSVAVVVQAAQAAAQASAASTGAGAFLLLLLEAEALSSLRPFAAGNASCEAQLDALQAALLGPHAADALRSALPGGMNFSDAAATVAAQHAQQDAFLRQLSLSQLSWRAALAGDAVTAGTLCAALPATPLWRHLSAAAAAAGGESPACPQGFQPVASSGSSGSSNGSDPTSPPCQREGNASAAGVPAGLQGLKGAPPPDALPAVYITAAAAPAGCAAVLQSYAAGPSLIAQALLRCWEREGDEAEASRCLHALPFAALEDQVLEGVLQQLLRCPGSGTAASAPEPRSDPAAVWGAAVLQLNRGRALQGRLPTLVGNAAKRSAAAWRTALLALEDGWARGAECGMLGTLCSALEQLPAPPTEEDLTRLEQLVAVQGAQCPETTRARVLGRAQQARRVAAKAGPEVCSVLK